MKKIKNILLNFMFKLLVPFSKTQESTNTKRVLIVTTTAIGDTMWATPAIEYLSKVHNCKVDCLTSTLGIQVLANNPHINELICFQISFLNNIKLIKKMMMTSYDEVFHFHSSQRIVPYLGYLANPKAFYGIKEMAEKASNLFVDVIRYKDHINSHHIYWRLMLVKKIYKDNGDFKPVLRWYVADSEENQVEEFLSEHGLEKGKYIFIQPGASRKYRQWSPEYFKLIVKKLSDNLGKKVIVSGSAKELDLLQRISENQNDNVVVVLGNLPLRVVAGIIKYAQFMLTNDTGPMHIGAAFSIPMVYFMLKENYSFSIPFMKDQNLADAQVVEDYDKNHYITSISIEEIWHKIVERIN